MLHFWNHLPLKLNSEQSDCARSYFMWMVCRKCSMSNQTDNWMGVEVENVILCCKITSWFRKVNHWKMSKIHLVARAFFKFYLFYLGYSESNHDHVSSQAASHQNGFSGDRNGKHLYFLHLTTPFWAFNNNFKICLCTLMFSLCAQRCCGLPWLRRP